MIDVNAIVKKLSVVLILISLRAYAADRDVASVSFRGDCTNFGMQVESSYFADDSFLIVTTGARFEYVPGEMKIYQGLGNDLDRRLAATLAIEGVGKFEKVEANDDHVLLWSENLNIGIYGDSTCILAPKRKLNIRFTGNFKPDYEGRYKGELLLIDEAGGMEIYPQRYEAGYEVKRIELGKRDWIAEYVLNANERVMVAAFPGRDFDWEKSFKSHLVITTGGFGLDHPYAFGVMPPDDVIKKWSSFLDIIAVHHNGLWKSGKSWGPYIVANGPEFERLVATAHKHEMKVIAHASVYYFFWKDKNIEHFYQQVKAIYDKYGTDGVYIDGLTFDYKLYKIDNKILNWEIIRRLRQLFGSDGVIVIHDTSLGSPVGTVPNIDSYCDATHNGEGVSFKSINDPYVKYQVRKYGISNTIGLWLRGGGAKPDYISDKEVIDALLAMNCRDYWNGYVFWKERRRNLPHKYYMEQLEKLKQKYYAERKSGPN